MFVPFNSKQKRIIKRTFILIIILYLFPPWYILIGEHTIGGGIGGGQWYIPDFWGIHFRYNPVMKPTLEQYDSLKNKKHDPKVYNIEEVGILSLILYIEIFIVILISSILVYKVRTKKFKPPNVLDNKKDSLNNP
jgi:hypothetical protein